MLLVGFFWLLIASFASLVVKLVLPGRWEVHGPTVMMVVATTSSLTAMLAIALTEGVNGFGPPPNVNMSTALIASLVGALVGFVGYCADVKRRASV